MKTALDLEIEAFRAELPKLLQEESLRGKFALVHGGVIHSFWNSVDEALDEGYDQFNTDTFLVKEVTDHEQPKYFSRNVKQCH